MHKVKTILIRLPNWLGDMVMASSFVKAVQQQFPKATVDVIAKKGIDFLLESFPAHGQRYIFSKEAYPGLKGAIKFGKEIRSQKKYDLFFCLPDSLSAAAMAKASGAKKTIGFKKNIHFLLLNKTYERRKGIHRTEEYVDLLAQFLKKEIRVPPVSLSSDEQEKTNALIININSEASSRRLPAEKAVSIIDTIRQTISNDIILIGSPKEAEFVTGVFEKLSDKTNITNIAGKTSLPQLMNIFAAAKAVLSTDSGPAHVSNALGINTVVLFGAGNENNTAPYNRENRVIIRLGKLPCEPCTKNVCKLYGIPECLLQLDEKIIAANVQKIMN